MLPEDEITEYKSLRKVTDGKTGRERLAETCVCLANARGGTIYVGIEDGEKAPPNDHVVSQELLNKTIIQLRNLTDSVGLLGQKIITHENGGQYFRFKVAPSNKTIATTSSGRVLIRVSDNCVPVSGNELTQLAEERGSFQWELALRNNFLLSAVPPENITKLVADLRKSPRVKNVVKERDDLEILDHYQLTLDGVLTNLGVLWLGTPAMRARIAYPVTMQYIVYDNLEQKVRKVSWHDNDLNPKELLLDFEKAATELRYYHEFPQGLLRTRIAHYPQEVIRELLINAIAHRSYTLSADIFVRVYSDRLEVTSPGSLPLTITPNNILRKSFRRNPKLVNILHDLELMEGEGSGFDLLYERASRDAKPFPTVEASFGEVTVIQASKILDEKIVQLIDYISRYFNISQQEMIVIGVVAREKKVLTTRLSQLVQVPGEDRLRSFVRKLKELEILITRGNRKGTEYLINPLLIRQSQIQLPPSLKTMDRNQLKAFITEDLKLYPRSSIRDIANRTKDILYEDFRKTVYAMTKEGLLDHTPAKSDRKYWLVKKNDFT